MSHEAEAVAPAGLVRAAVDLGRVPWIRPLVPAFLNDHAAVAELFAGDPRAAGAWRQARSRVLGRRRDRAGVAAAVTAQLDARGAPDPARAAARRLADPAAVAVVTGQQAGLFGGPLYTLLKAISALQLARRLESSGDGPVVPVFWVESEDHDWAEVRDAPLLDGDLTRRTVTVPDPPGAGSRPVGSLVFGDGVTAALDEARTVLPETEFTGEVFAALARAYRPDAGVGTAFAAWLDALLGSLGLVVFEAGDGALKPIAADLFAAELADPGRTTRLVGDAADELRRRGHDPQVSVTDDGVALFYVDAQGRHPIKRRGEGLAVGDAARPADTWIAEARAHPDRFSPNVLLRPLVQDRIFPTVGYVAGPSELAYQAQIGGLYHAFDVEPPLLWPRVTATIGDPAMVRFLDRYGLDLADLSGDGEAALRRLLEAQLPAGIDTAIDGAREDVTRRTAALGTAVAAIDPTLAGAVDTTRDRMLDTLQKMQNKIVQAAKRKDETLRRQFGRARALAFPGGAPQERAVALLVFLNRYGPSLPARLLEQLPDDPGKHYVLVP